jgi:hypothetical protein
MSTAPAVISAQIAGAAELGEEAHALLKENQPPREYLEALRVQGHLEDAVRFLAYSLPKREAVWWAWVCARRASGAEPAAPKVQAVLTATEKWISQPTDENRRAVMPAAEAAGIGTAAGCAAMGAFFSGGSIAPPDAPPVPPGPYLTAKFVATSIVVSAVATEPDKADQKLAAFLTQGLDVATRIKLW